jgi:hypothetical protein
MVFIFEVPKGKQQKYAQTTPLGQSRFQKARSQKARVPKKA